MKSSPPSDETTGLNSTIMKPSIVSVLKRIYGVMMTFMEVIEVVVIRGTSFAFLWGYGQELPKLFVY